MKKRWREAAQKSLAVSIVIMMFLSLSPLSAFAAAPEPHGFVSDYCKVSTANGRASRGEEKTPLTIGVYLVGADTAAASEVLYVGEDGAGDVAVTARESYRLASADYADEFFPGEVRRYDSEDEGRSVTVPGVTGGRLNVYMEQAANLPGRPGNGNGGDNNPDGVDPEKPGALETDADSTQIFFQTEVKVNGKGDAPATTFLFDLFYLDDASSIPILTKVSTAGAGTYRGAFESATGLSDGEYLIAERKNTDNEWENWNNWNVDEWPAAYTFAVKNGKPADFREPTFTNTYTVPASGETEEGEKAGRKLRVNASYPLVNSGTVPYINDEDWSKHYREDYLTTGDLLRYFEAYKLYEGIEHPYGTNYRVDVSVNAGGWQTIKPDKDGRYDVSGWDNVNVALTYGSYSYQVKRVYGGEAVVEETPVRLERAFADEISTEPGEGYGDYRFVCATRRYQYYNTEDKPLEQEALAKLGLALSNPSYVTVYYERDPKPDEATERQLNVYACYPLTDPDKTVSHIDWKDWADYYGNRDYLTADDIMGYYEAYREYGKDADGSPLLHPYAPYDPASSYFKVYYGEKPDDACSKVLLPNAKGVYDVSGYASVSVGITYGKYLYQVTRVYGETRMVEDTVRQAGAFTKIETVPGKEYGNYELKTAVVSGKEVDANSLSNLELVLDNTVKVVLTYETATDPENPGTTPGEPENPGTTPGEPENPGTTPGEPENPGTTPGEPENPGTTPGEPENPGTTPGEPENPGTTPGNPSNPPTTTPGGNGNIFYPPVGNEEMDFGPAPVMIPDEEVPLASLPEGENEITIIDEDVPLGKLPTTGFAAATSSNRAVAMSMLLVSLAVGAFAAKKVRDGKESGQ